MSKIIIYTTFCIAMLLTSCGGESHDHKKGNQKHHEGQEEKHGENPHHGHGEASETIVLGNDFLYPGEKHFANMKMMTNGGDNAEAYWSFADDKLVFQASYDKWNTSCDQIFIMNATEQYHDQTPLMVSTGKGRTTCSYFMPGDSTILYASTHLAMDSCPPVPHRGPNGEYVWPIYPEFDIFVADLEGNIVQQLTDRPGYDAEATVSPNGDKIVFTSLRSGDLELYTMNIDGSDVKQITSGLGYDGGAFFSPDGEYLLWRSSRPQTEEAQAQYKTLLKQGLVQPTEMELYIAKADGSETRQITELGGANWAPFFHPSGEKVLFASNHHSKSGRLFNLFLINLDGTGLEQVTFDNVFDSFPMFSFDGKKIAFSSNRGNNADPNAYGGATNVFVADWVD